MEAQYEKGIQELERISGLTSEQAKEYLLKSVEEDVKHDTAKLIKELEHKAKEEADKKARDLVVTAIHRCAADHVAETTVSVVQLPNDEMKGRIIGREGRNIRTLETLTGVELIIDDTPEACLLYTSFRSRIYWVTFLFSMLVVWVCLLYTSSAADHGRPEMPDRHLRIVPGQSLHRAEHYIR